MKTTIHIENNIQFYLNENEKVHREDGPAMIIMSEKPNQHFNGRYVNGEAWFINGEDITDDVHNFIDARGWSDEWPDWNTSQWTQFRLKFV